MKSPLYSAFRNATFNEYDFNLIITKIAIKIVVKIHSVVNGDNLDWPTYAITLRARQFENQNTGTSVTITKANCSICGPIYDYVILFPAQYSISTFFDKALWKLLFFRSKVI